MARKKRLAARGSRLGLAGSQNSLPPIIPGPRVYGFTGLTLPGYHSVHIFSLNSSLAFEAHIWSTMQKIFICLFGDENEHTLP